MFNWKRRTLGVLLGAGLGLTLLAGGCATAGAVSGAQVPEAEAETETAVYTESHALVAAPVLGVLVDGTGRVLEVYSGEAEYLGDELGIQVDDVVLLINDMPIVYDRKAIIELNRSFDSRSELDVLVLRKGEELLLTASLADYRAEVVARQEEYEEMVEEMTEEELDALSPPYDPATALPTVTPIPQDTYFL